MNKNPYNERIKVLQREHNKDCNLLQDCETKLAWFQGFNLDQANFDLRRAGRLEADVQARFLREKHVALGMMSSVKELTPQASMSFDPRYWFSSERTIAKRQLQEAEKKLALQESKVAGIDIELSKAVELNREIHCQIEMARTFDPLLAHSTIVALRAILEPFESQMENLCQRRDYLDMLLAEPLASFHKLEEEQAKYKEQISRAEAFDRELTNAPNSYEKRLVHDRCENELGDSKPGNVLRKSRGLLRRIDDNIGKLQARLDGLIRFGTLDIRHIVIDGNNLCYEGGSNFLKFAALDSIVPILARKHEVTLIFDASIRQKMSLSNKDMEAKFPQAKQVHIVAKKADETILSVAGDDPHTFVLSNDRFVDYPEKAAVKEGRVLRHEIVGQVAYIHDLQIEARFEIEV